MGGGEGGFMEQQDEVFESIPWDRFSQADPLHQTRRWAGVAVLVVVVGAGAYFARGVSADPAPVAAVEVPEPSEPAPVPTTETVPATVGGLWAEEPAEPGTTAVVAERFAAELISAVDGVRVIAASAGDVVERSGVSTVDVTVTMTGAEQGIDTVVLTVEVDQDGAIRRWSPGVADPLEVRWPSPGAEVPADVLSDLTRQAGRWGTTLEVLSSGLADDRWWAELLVQLPSGIEVPVMTWESTSG